MPECGQLSKQRELYVLGQVLLLSPNPQHRCCFIKYLEKKINTYIPILKQSKKFHFIPCTRIKGYHMESLQKIRGVSAALKVFEAAEECLVWVFLTASCKAQALLQRVPKNHVTHLQNPKNLLNFLIVRRWVTSGQGHVTPLGLASPSYKLGRGCMRSMADWRPTPWRGRHGLVSMYRPIEQNQWPDDQERLFSMRGGVTP